MCVPWSSQMKQYNFTLYTNMNTIFNPGKLFELENTLKEE